MSAVITRMSSDIAAYFILVGDIQPFSAAMSSTLYSIVKQNRKDSISSTAINELGHGGAMVKFEPDETGKDSIPMPLFSKKSIIPGAYKVNISITGPKEAMEKLESAVVLWVYGNETAVRCDYGAIALVIVIAILRARHIYSEFSKDQRKRFHHLTTLFQRLLILMIAQNVFKLLGILPWNILVVVLYSLVCVTAMFGIRYSVISLIYEVRQIAHRRIGPLTVVILSIFTALDAYSIFMKNLALFSPLTTTTYTSGLLFARRTEIMFLIICMWFIFQSRNCLEPGEGDRHKLYSLYVIVLELIAVAMTWIPLMQPELSCNVEDMIRSLSYTIYAIFMLQMHWPDLEEGDDGMEVEIGEAGKSLFDEN